MARRPHVNECFMPTSCVDDEHARRSTGSATGMSRANGGCSGRVGDLRTLQAGPVGCVANGGGERH